MKESNSYQSAIDPLYLRGDFFKASTGGIDADYKVQQLRNLIQSNKSRVNLKSGRVADVGCGNGKTTYALRKMLTELQELPIKIHGYDIHPYVSEIAEEENVHFFPVDFLSISHQEIYDLIVLFDVIEHIPDPIRFLRLVSQATCLIALHIPLDDSVFAWLRGLQKVNLSHPGHLLALDASAAMNLITFSGLRIMDFAYSPVFKAPSGRATMAQRSIKPLREILFRISPYLTQKLLAGVSLTVLAWTSNGLSSR